MHLLAVMASTLQDVARMDDGKGGVFVALVWPGLCLGRHWLSDVSPPTSLHLSEKRQMPAQ